jgi:hypothetical protein
VFAVSGLYCYGWWVNLNGERTAGQAPQFARPQAGFDGQPVAEGSIGADHTKEFFASSGSLDQSEQFFHCECPPIPAPIGLDV